RARAALIHLVIACLCLSIAAAAADERPNIVLILADDAALMDFGVYGGEARTPHIDALAAAGTWFTHYRTAPLCSPSRAMLLTGLDAHAAGVSTIPEVLPSAHRGRPGYGTALGPGVTTVATHLAAAGYRTYMTGKWHLGHGPGELPADHGFERSFALDASGADNHRQQSYMPYYRTADWFDGHQRAELPDDFYSSRFLIDRMIDYVGTGADDRPFFAYVAFQAVHIPLQAPAHLRDRYRDLYAAGWDVLRAQRVERARRLGLLPVDADTLPRPAPLRAWDTLDADTQALAAQSMAVNAGMLDAMDEHVGRLVQHLRAIGELDRTVFFITSDNGPEPSDPLAAVGMSTWLRLNGYRRDLDTLGERDSYAFIGPEWAWAAAAPSHLFKFQTTEGGLRAPLIVSGPGIRAAARADGPAFVSDIAPTMLALAGLPPPTLPAPAAGSSTSEAQRHDLRGRSLLPVLHGDQETVRGANDPFGFEISGNAALYLGPWKLVRNLPPWDEGRWRLYHMPSDPGETRDRAETDPEARLMLEAAWARYADAAAILPLPANYQMQRQIVWNTLQRQWHLYPGLMLGSGLVLLALMGLVAHRVRRCRFAAATGRQ
ncbi:MAG: arylsulfatase, partial [Gammaproteobacteria bacterium]